MRLEKKNLIEKNRHHFFAISPSPNSYQYPSLLGSRSDSLLIRALTVLIGAPDPCAELQLWAEPEEFPAVVLQ